MLKTSVRYFTAVVHHGSIRAAANFLRIHQSAVSRQIQALEDEYGAALLERHARGIRLTTAGEVLFANVREVGFAVDRARSEIDALQGLKRGHVRVHTIEALVTHLVPQTIRRFQEQYPGVDFEVMVVSSDLVIEAVKQGVTDLGLSFTTPLMPGVARAHRLVGKLRAIMRPDHPLVNMRELSVRNLATWPIGLTSRMTSSRVLFDRACERIGIELQPKLETNSVALLHQYAFTQDAIAVTSPYALIDDIKSKRLVARPFIEPELSAGNFEILTMVGRKPSVAAERFLLFLGREFERMAHGEPEP